MPGYGNISMRRWYNHEVPLPEIQHDDGYIYKAVAKPKLSNPMPGDDVSYEYVDIEITYDFDFLGTYNTDAFTNKIDEIIAIRNSKGLPETHSNIRAKGEPRPNTSAAANQNAVKTSIHGNTMVEPQMKKNGIEQDSPWSWTWDRGQAEDAASVALTIGGHIVSGMDDVFSKQANTLFAASEKSYKQFEPVLNEAIEHTIKELQDNEQLFKNIEKTIENSYHDPNGPSIDEIKKYNEALKETRAKEITKTATDAADECLKKGGSQAKEGALALNKAKFFRTLGKVFEKAGVAIVFAEVFYSYYESIDGDKDKFIDAVYGFAINIGVLVLAEIGAGMATGATVGAAGGPAGIILGVVVGVVIGLIDAVVLGFTGESLGHWLRVGIHKVFEGIDWVVTEVSKPVARAAQPAMSNAMRDMTTVAPGFSWWDVIRSMGGGF